MKNYPFQEPIYRFYLPTKSFNESLKLIIFWELVSFLKNKN